MTRRCCRGFRGESPGGLELTGVATHGLDHELDGVTDVGDDDGGGGVVTSGGVGHHSVQ